MTISSNLMSRRFTRTFLIIAILLPIILALALPVFGQNEQLQPTAPDKPATTQVAKVSNPVSKTQKNEVSVTHSSQPTVKPAVKATGE